MLQSHSPIDTPEQYDATDKVLKPGNIGDLVHLLNEYEGASDECYRQYIELALKEVISKHGGQVEPEIVPNWKSHKLGELWAHCKTIMQETLFETPVDDIPGVRALEGLINEFQGVDEDLVFL